MQESLLPDTKAIRRATVEWQHYRRGYLVRHKSMSGSVVQRQFKDAEEANGFFWQRVRKLAAEAGIEWRL